MQYEIISTGSKGNAVVIENQILIDCGVSFKSIKDVYKQLKLVLLTHCHSDHFKIKTIGILARERPTLRFACGEFLVKGLVDAGVSKRNIDILENGKIYDYKAFKVSPVKLYHDVKNFGYRLYVGGCKGIYITDTGHVKGIVAKNYDLYLIEANFTDEDIKSRIEEKRMTGQYVYEERVLQTHLSKEMADEFILANAGSNSEYVYLHQHEEILQTNIENI